MAKQNVSPTKSSLLKIRQDLNIAREGYELLEQKREILVMELMSYVERVKRIEKELDKLIFDAYDSLKKAIIQLGQETVDSKTQYINYDYSIRKKNIKIMGMLLPSLEAEPPHLQMQYSFLNTNAIVDETSEKFLKLINTICEMAEIRNIVWRLSQEVKKTQRRVNALEKVVIPESSETIKFIEDTLEERERDEMFIRKMVKEKLER